MEPHITGNDIRNEPGVPSPEELQALQSENAALRARCGMLEAVIEAVPDAIFVKDIQGRYVTINAAGARLLGKPVDEVIGESAAYRIVHEKNQAKSETR